MRHPEPWAKVECISCLVSASTVGWRCCPGMQGMGSTKEELRLKNSAYPPPMFYLCVYVEGKPNKVAHIHRESAPQSKKMAGWWDGGWLCAAIRGHEEAECALECR